MGEGVGRFLAARAGLKCDVAFNTEVAEGTERKGGRRRFFMRMMKFTCWRDGDYYLGFWNDYPDYVTQGMSKDELVSNLRDLLVDMESGEVPYVRRG
jgi:hypothetical protein